MDRATIDGDRARIGRVVSVDDLHERALSRAVLSEDSVDLATCHPQVYAVVGDDSWKHLGDVAQLKQWRWIPTGAVFNSRVLIQIRPPQFAPSCLTPISWAINL